MIELIKSLDIILLDLINGTGRPFLDPIMIFLSNKYVWIPLYMYLIFFLYTYYGKYFWIPLLFILISLTLSDQFTSSFMKPYFQRLRPCLDENINIFIEVVKGCGGKYGFASSHAANSMGLAVFYLMILKRKKNAELLYFDLGITGWLFAGLSWRTLSRGYHSRLFSRFIFWVLMLSNVPSHSHEVKLISYLISSGHTYQ